MIATRKALRRDDEALPSAAQDSAAVPSPAEHPANCTEQVIAAFIAAARGGAGARESAFDVAVRIYLDHFPQTDRSAAARIVADIISHRS